TGGSRATIRLASYNLRDFLDDRKAAARVVRALDPDVLCLQEVPRRLLSTWRVSDFAAECQMYWSGHHRGSGGTTIFTSLRVQAPASTHHRLPVRLGVRRRGYAVVTVAPPGHLPLTVASVHLSLDGDQRLRHTEQLLGELPQSGRSLIAGDLNEGDEGRAYARLAEGHRLVTDGAYTFPATHPDKALDVVFATPDVVVRPGRPVPLDEADVRAASDHRPVWVEVEVTPR
ncbi:MAG: endonuclease/exonuclease/phosphatase family protein, partial [Lapillicoccus sp.]